MSASAKTLILVGMIKNARYSGYTVVEVMMFLAISGVLFMIAGTYINGQQQAAQFSQGLRDFESKIQDTVNGVATGNYPDAGTFVCTVNESSGNLDFAAGGAKQGTNKECVFIGKVIQLAPQETGPDGLNIFTVAGRRLDSYGDEIQRLDESIPTPVAIAASIANTSGIDLTGRENLKWGLKATRIISAGSRQDVAAIGFISDFGRYSSFGTSNLVSGAQSVSPVLPLGALNKSLDDMVSTIRSLKETDRTRGREGLIVCFRSANDDRKGAVTINAQGGTSVIIDQTDQIVGEDVCP